ncbi:hypothetical protein ACFWVU_21060 [Streptomyces sp. NPDC058686]|uniref:hypothetical protein n=1 Tax=Streptomyces sp. NPDC058686 TaxID=3346599 RepID=UPI00366136E3
MTPESSAKPAGTSKPAECRGCQELDLAEAVAKSERDASKVSDCRVLRERHQTAEHGGQS